MKTKHLEPEMRVELTTSRLRSDCSTTELFRHAGAIVAAQWIFDKNRYLARPPKIEIETGT